MYGSDSLDTFTVTFSESEAYVILGEKTVKKGETYSFQVKPNKFYDLSDITVTSNGVQCIKAGEMTYQSLDVREDLYISVTGEKAEYLTDKTGIQVLKGIELERQSKED